MIDARSSDRQRTGRVFFIAGFAAALLPLLETGLWNLPAVFILPGAALAAWLPSPFGRPMSPVLRGARALLLSVVIAGLLATGLEFLHLRGAWRAALAGLDVVSLVALFLLSRRHDASDAGPGFTAHSGPGFTARSGPGFTARSGPGPGPDSHPAAGPDVTPDLTPALWIGLALALAVLLPPLVRPWIAERADSWFHAAVVSEISRTGIPPQDPYFAGFRLQYMWFYHMIVAAILWSTRMSVFQVMALLNAVTIWCLTVLAADLVLALGRGRRAAIWASVILPAGLCALFWVFFPLRLLRAATGSVSGGAKIAEAFRLLPLDILRTRAFLSDFGSVPFFLNKFLTGTAYGLSLAFLLLYLAAVLRFAGTGRRGFLVPAGISVFAMLLLHPVVGISALAASGLSGISILALGRKRGGLAFGAVLLWGIAALAGAAAAFPYLRSVTRGKPDDQLLPLHFDFWVIVGIGIGCFFVFLAAIGPLRRLWRDGRPEGRLFVCWTLATALFGSVIRLPGPNTTDKFTYLIYVPLALAAAIWAADAWRGRRGVVLALLVLLPVNAIGYAGYWGDADRRERSPEDVAMYSWISRETPRDAVFLENAERVGVLVEGPRRLYWGRQAYAEQWGYDRTEMARRRAVRDAIYAPGQPIDPAAIRSLGAVGAPVFVIVRAADFTSPGDFHKLDAYAEWFTPVYETSGVRIYRLAG